MFSLILVEVTPGRVALRDMVPRYKCRCLIVSSDVVLCKYHRDRRYCRLGITQLLKNEIAYRYVIVVIKEFGLNSSSSLYLSVDKSLQLPLAGLMAKLNERQR